MNVHHFGETRRLYPGRKQACTKFKMHLFRVVFGLKSLTVTSTATTSLESNRRVQGEDASQTSREAVESATVCTRAEAGADTVKAHVPGGTEAAARISPNSRRKIAVNNIIPKERTAL